jgi:DeoR/GlpR family transcriptional regulator of sugar metabolism
MLTEQRKRILLERLKAEGRIVAKDVSTEMGLSEDTIRRDLRELASAGLLLRVHGGALPASPTVVPLDARRGLAVAEKQRLGLAGAKLVSPGQTVFIDGGTTNLELVRNLPLDLAATVITHSPTIAAALEPHAGIDVILIGGSLLRHSMVATGAVALDAIARLRVDLCFIGLTGLHPQEGATTGNYEEAAIKRVLVTRSAEVVTLVTAEKLGAVSPYTVCGTEAITAAVVAREWNPVTPGLERSTLRVIGA